MGWIRVKCYIYTWHGVSAFNLLLPLIFSDHPKRPREEDPRPPYNVVRNFMDMGYFSLWLNFLYEKILYYKYSCAKLNRFVKIELKYNNWILTKTIHFSFLSLQENYISTYDKMKGDRLNQLLFQQMIEPYI